VASGAVLIASPKPARPQAIRALLVAALGLTRKVRLFSFRLSNSHTEAASV
jgi:hypothetical protein